MGCIFTKPFVFEIVGGGFEKPTNCSFYIPRHPRVCKIHWDRSYLEAMSFSELQEAAIEALNVQGEDYKDMETESQWIEKLLEKDMTAKELGKRNLEMGAGTESTKRRKKPQVDPTSAKQVTETTALFPTPPPSNRPAAGLRDILQPPNTPGRRSLLSNSTASFGSLEPKTKNPSKCTRTLVDVPENGRHKPPPAKKSRLSGFTATKVLGQQAPKQRLGERIPSHIAIRTSASTGTPQLKNGHSSISPLRGATVFLPHYLMKFPKLLERITNHDAEIIHVLPTTAENTVLLMPASKKAVVLVESNKTSLTKKTLKSLYDMLKKINGGLDEGQRYSLETYDWRIVNHNQPEGVWEKDWSLWHVWSVM